MKKLLVISALLFSMNGFTEEKFCFATVSNQTNADPEAIIRYNCEEG
ncbi:MAG: hypothetical protein HOK34_02075, partial [Gammaproteobacteria bacterium]|nr:hypothetical protein [Gammaproteobacteria bacterium]